MRTHTLSTLPKDIVDDLERELQSDSLRPIKFVRLKSGAVNKLDINFGTILKIPTYRPPARIGYNHPVYQTMAFLELIRPADGGPMNAQEQFDWIKIANKHGFRNL